MTRHVAMGHLRRAEKAAGLSHVRGGGFHAFRRQSATDRKGLPVQDVMRAGRWRHAAALQTAYQDSDAQTTIDVVNYVPPQRENVG